MIQLVHSKFHPNLRHLFSGPTTCTMNQAKPNSPSSVLEEHKANPLGFNMWALPIVEVILPQSWDLKAMVSQATFCLEKSPRQKDPLPTFCQQQKHANGILEKSTPAKQLMAISDSKLQLLPHEGFLMKTHHKADTKDPALTNGDQPTHPTCLLPFYKDCITILGNGPFYLPSTTSSASTRKEKKRIFLLIEIPPPFATKTRTSSFAEQIGLR